ncbi:hypothetical protein KSP39_PZI002925 [Platanthera zijinensis]|uniref:Serine aminopeptidase S33 domain-containing protein n=1 Tax=Platanthera zijinensis TaxID=2320716 RepID=A0AAP0C174_9ASPA
MAGLHPINSANATSPYGDLSRQEFYDNHHIIHHESTFAAPSTDSTLFTQSWRPAPPAAPLRGAIAMLHGYLGESGWLFELTAVAFARLGFHAVSLDLPGHGRSSGPRGHLPCFSHVVSDCISFFNSSFGSELPLFLYGESLGGAISVLIAAEQKLKWRGVVLNGPMCGLSRRIKPPWPLELLLPAVAVVAPRWRVWVTGNPIDASYKVGWKRDLARGSPAAQKSEYAPAATAREMLRLCEEVGRRGREVEAAMLVVHGGEDAVCEVEAAERLYGTAASRDKKMVVLPEAWHLLVGESEETVEMGFGLIFQWVVERANGRLTVV